MLYYHVRKKALYPQPQQDLARAIKEIIDSKTESGRNPGVACRAENGDNKDNREGCDKDFCAFG